MLHTILALTFQLFLQKPVGRIVPSRLNKLSSLADRINSSTGHEVCRILILDSTSLSTHRRVIDTEADAEQQAV